MRLGHDLNTFEPLAVKIVDLKKVGRDVFDSELAIMRDLPEQRNIPRLLGHFCTCRKAFLVLEYLPFPTLHSFVRSHHPLTGGQCAFILRQLVRQITSFFTNGIAAAHAFPPSAIRAPQRVLLYLETNSRISISQTSSFCNLADSPLTFSLLRDMSSCVTGGRCFVHGGARRVPPRPQE